MRTISNAFLPVSAFGWFPYNQRMDIKNWLIESLAAKGWSPYKLSQETYKKFGKAKGVSQSTVARIKSGYIASPSIDVVKKLADTLETEMPGDSSSEPVDVYTPPDPSIIMRVDEIAAEIFDAVGVTYKDNELELFDKTDAEEYKNQIAIIKHHLYKLYTDEPAACGLSPTLTADIIRRVLDNEYGKDQGGQSENNSGTD